MEGMSLPQLIADAILEARRLRDDADARDKRELSLVVTNLEQAGLWYCEHIGRAHLGEQALIDWLLQV